MKEIIELCSVILLTYTLAATLVGAGTVFVVAPIVALKNEFSCRYLEEEQFIQRGLTRIGTFLALIVLVFLCAVVLFSFGRTAKFNNDVTNQFIGEEIEGTLN